MLFLPLPLMLTATCTIWSLFKISTSTLVQSSSFSRVLQKPSCTGILGNERVLLMLDKSMCMRANFTNTTGVLMIFTDERR